MTTRKNSLLAAAAAVLLTTAAPASSAPAAARTETPVDYFAAGLTTKRVLDWGDRPNWSPDGKRLVFTRNDVEDGPAYEIDLASGKGKCLTCRFGANGQVTRIFFLPDGSFLIEAGRNLETTSSQRGGGSGEGAASTALYWMAADARMPPQSLQAAAIGDIAILSNPLPEGGFRIAWGACNADACELTVADLLHDGSRAVLANRRIVYSNSREKPDSRASFPEAYDFTDDGKTITFWTLVPRTLESAMYRFSLADSSLVRQPSDGAHNETHLFPDGRHGLEESNRASDPDGPVRGVSALAVSTVTLLLKAGGKEGRIDPVANADKPFDLYVTVADGSRKPRRLTFFSDRGGAAHQSTPAPDGRRIAYAVRAPAEGPLAGQSGLYVAAFGPSKPARREP